MNYLKIEFGFGIEKDRDDMSISRYESNVALIAIKRKAVELFDSYTLVLTFGGWKNGGGRHVEESGYTLFTTQHSKASSFGDKIHDAALYALVHGMAEFIKATLNQEAVAVAITPVNFELI